MSVRKSVGNITAYAAAVKGGYTGTYEEFCAEQANFAKNAQKVAEDRAAVEKLKTDTQTIKDAAVKDVGDAKNAALTSIENTTNGKLTAIQTAGSAQVEAVQDAGALEVEDVENAGKAERAALDAAAEAKTAEVEERIEAKGAAVLETILEDYTETYQRALRNESRISRNEKRLTNLEQGITPDPYETDDTVAYMKAVPANALPFAEVNKVGGMTYRINVGTEEEPVYELRSAPVTEVVGGAVIRSWKDVQRIVRAGLARNVFHIGDQLVCEKDGAKLVWDVIGIDHDTPADANLTHSMTLQLHDLWQDSLVYDAPEAIWYIDAETYPDGLAAGTYYFTLPADYDATYGGGSTFNFTLANAIPVGGQIYFGWGYQKQAADCKITTYASVGATTAIETVSVAAGQAGTAMPALHATTVTGNTNCVHRIRYGSNNWAESAMRQWLNTDAAANSWWEAKTVFDRPANASKAGFLNKLDPAFLDVVGTVTKKTQLSISDEYGMHVAEERFFLLSRPEVFAGVERSADGADGEPYEFYGAGYSDYTSPNTGADTNRIKYRNGTAYYWWLRTPVSGGGLTVRYVYPTGYLYYSGASDSLGVAPACVIV